MKNKNSFKAIGSILGLGFICLTGIGAQAQPKHELNKNQYRILTKEEMSAKPTQVVAFKNQFENPANYKNAPKPLESANLPSENLPVNYNSTGVGVKGNYKSQFVPKNN